MKTGDRGETENFTRVSNKKIDDRFFSLEKPEKNYIDQIYNRQSNNMQLLVGGNSHYISF